MKTVENRCKKKIVLFWCAQLLIACIIILTFLGLMGNIDQKYTDVIIEYTAIFSSNKSAEMNLVFILIVLGSLSVLIFHFAFSKSRPLKLNGIIKPAEDKNLFICILITITFFYFLFYQKTDQLLLLSAVISVVLLIIDRELVLPGLCFYYSAYYALIAFFRMYVWIGGEISTNTVLLSLLSIVMTILLLGCNNRRRAFLRAILILQILIPALLLFLFQSKYLYNGEIINISIPNTAATFVIIYIVIAAICAFLNMLRKWNCADNTSDVVSVGSCAAIMAFNFFGTNGAIISSDFHHPFENIIGYSQIFEYGQTPFSEYLPTSGLYSVVHGAFFKFFGNDAVSFYTISTNIFYLCVITLIVILLCTNINKAYVFLISLCYLMTDYNRSIFILPIMLLLLTPKLLKRKGAWLAVWFFSSYLHGLYYPLYGVAVCLAFAPLGLWQIVSYIKSGEIKEDAKTIKFWVILLLCVTSALLGIPLLYGTLRHLTAMAGQSIYSDGIARFGQMVPEAFLPYLINHPSLRLVCYYLITFLVPAVYIWVALYFTLMISGAYITRKRVHIDKPALACLGISLVIMPVIAYTFTTVRLEPGVIISRSYGPLFAVSIILIVLAVQYCSNIRLQYVVFCFSVLIIALNPALGFSVNESKLTYCYTVPNGYTFVNDDQVSRLGTGFIDTPMYEEVESLYNFARTLDSEKDYSLIGPSFGFHYLSELKGSSSIEFLTVKGFGAAEETAKVFRNNKSIVGGGYINTIENYYIYNWLLTSGEYYWSNDLNLFLPAEDDMDRKTALERNKDVFFGSEGKNEGLYASALGSSWNSLSTIFSDPDISLNISNEEYFTNIGFSREIIGDEADFLYIEFSNADLDFDYTVFDLSGQHTQSPDEISPYLLKKRYNPGKTVVVNWTDEYGTPYSIYCEMGKGKLLIPLGGGTRWLLHNHAGISISIEMNGEKIPIPEIKTAKMLKLREVG